ncbi:hypothetical protein Tco_0743344 [Tanacetum coccineum]
MMLESMCLDWSVDVVATLDMALLVVTIQRDYDDCMQSHIPIIETASHRIGHNNITSRCIALWIQSYYDIGSGQQGSLRGPHPVLFAPPWEMSTGLDSTLHPLGILYARRNFDKVSTSPGRLPCFKPVKEFLEDVGHDVADLVLNAAFWLAHIEFFFKARHLRMQLYAI